MIEWLDELVKEVAPWFGVADALFKIGKFALCQILDYYNSKRKTSKLDILRTNKFGGFCYQRH